MATQRTKSISTKVTATEYADIAERASPRTVSEWTRDVVLGALHPDPLHVLVLAEVLALRTILLNLNYALAANELPPADVMRGLIDQVDAEKLDKARDRIATLQPTRKSTSRDVGLPRG